MNSQNRQPEMNDQSEPTTFERISNWVWSQWHWMRKRWWRRWAMDIALGLLLIWGITAYQTRHLVETGEQIEPMTLQTADGGTASLVDPDAHKTLVYGWATWCGVCAVQTGTVQWAKSLLSDDVAVRNVVFDYRSAAHARESAHQKGMTGTLLGTPELRRQLNISGYPTFYVISADHEILSQTQGYTTTIGLWWRAQAWW